jgi:hypothetical protein
MVMTDASQLRQESPGSRGWQQGTMLDDGKLHANSNNIAVTIISDAGGIMPELQAFRNGKQLSPVYTAVLDLSKVSLYDLGRRSWAQYVHAGARTLNDVPVMVSFLCK